MKVIHGSSKWREKEADVGVALGNFDGVHRGHQAILRDLVQTVQKEGWLGAVYTFEPHPAKVLAPETAPLLIQTPEQKLEALASLGLDIVVLEAFDLPFSRLTPEKFFHEILVKRLKPVEIWVGYDFTFGVHRRGNIPLLESLCRGNKIGLHVIQAQFAMEMLMSSTQIRTLIAQGNVALAGKLLGRPFALRGKVVKGAGIGGKMGIHTANLHCENELLPKTGIYITLTKIKTGGGWKSWPSATSVGFNPTFPGKGFSVETHLIGFEGGLRGKKMEVAFLSWLREEWTFPNAETLAAQIQKDIAEALKFHETLRHRRQTAG